MVSISGAQVSKKNDRNQCVSVVAGVEGIVRPGSGERTELKQTGT